MNVQPTVSVAIPTYNAPACTRETIQSVRDQTFTDFEVVIINDGSTDDTVERLEAYTDGDERFRIITQSNGGIGVARNRAITESRGRYIAFLDHDDLWLPHKLQEQVSFMKANPTCASCLARWKKVEGQHSYPREVDEITNADHVCLNPAKAHATIGSFIMTSALMVDRQRTAKYRYAEKRGAIEDVPYWFGLYEHPMGIVGDHALVEYRVHETNFSRQYSFYVDGIDHLRALQADNMFEGLMVNHREEVEAIMGQIAHVAIAVQLVHGHRYKALKLYRRERSAMLSCQRSRRFAKLFPLAIGLPRFMLVKRWSRWIAP